ncbi:hypothetical protein A3A95_01240 [Candidatus Nomurabacteria bacterium RIFCSPLOWO2_01_FULL_39_18]|uniref:Uncharacterized protein n=1 Tax=Candidatus Nomurabacteria bacterium RIFCSPHIGHO2_01_FULL_40_24b TaxID=1801739 RepID=A0A1F6V8L8_9BACT|nr:MAG: hypothetical protein A2647_00450 [Candidatus Nomurabacteria bacterium RIFCSPHIGHO2_01_FULL_40_24b]OGI88913.1 MAG: hypothetical protein A3A95_01240 [Candidatus Nomurabacteria bacterium RIFCSPLOWO2_01_FULL_39_18]
MFEFLFKIWYMIAVLPFLLFHEGNKRLTDFLKKRNIYSGWDVWHSLLVVLIILFVILWFNGYRF